MSDIDNPKHTKITSYEPSDDETIMAVTESYYEELVGRKTDVIKSIRTNYNDFLSDLVACVDVISKHQTKELDLKITVDEWGKPCRIIKQYTIKREDFKRR